MREKPITVGNNISGKYVSRIIRFAYLPTAGNATPPTAGNPLFMPIITLIMGGVLNASVCPVKNVPALPARIDIYICK